MRRRGSGPAYVRLNRSRPLAAAVGAVLLPVGAAACAGGTGSVRSTAASRDAVSTTSTTSAPSPTAEDDLGGPGAPTVAGPVVTPGAGGAPGPAACRSGDPLANVYHPNRLSVRSPCTTVSGTVRSVRSEPDGDLHFDVQLDPDFTHLLTPASYSEQHGWMVAEIVPADEPGCTRGQPPRPSSGSYDYGICTGADESPPAVGAHVSVTGPYVVDEDHQGWAEIHPVWAVSGAGPEATTPPPPTTTPSTTQSATPSTGTSPPTTAAVFSGSCTATVSNPAPAPGGDETVSVTSNMGNRAGTVTAHYRTTDHAFPIQTDVSGRAQVTFSVGHPTAGYTVRVDVDLSGRAACSTSFTPQ